MSSSVEDRPRFLRLVELLEAPARESMVEAWDIGEQEAAIHQLIDRLSASSIAVSGLDCARIAVLAEEWGCWDAADASLDAVPRHDDGTVALIEATEEGDALNEAIAHRTAGTPDANGTVAIAWMRCLKCGDVFVRIHEVMPWGLSLTVDAYAIARMDRPAQGEAFIRRYPNGSTALMALIDAHVTQA